LSVSSNRLHYPSIDASPAPLRPLTEFARKLGGREANLPEDRAGELDLQVEQAIANACAHAFPTGRPGAVTVTDSVLGPGEWSVEVACQGVGFNPLQSAPRDLTLSLEQRPLGGLDIHLVKSFAGSLTDRREDGWNRLTFTLSAGS
jgi:anti-sigma regulatory factor (Ser/Thr protein kinase)